MDPDVQLRFRGNTTDDRSHASSISFARAATAYWIDRDGYTSAASGTPRYTYLGCSSQGKGEIKTGHGPGGEDMLPLGIDSNGWLYCNDGTGDGDGVWRTNDNGSNWHRCITDTFCDKMFNLGNGDMMLFLTDADSWNHVTDITNTSATVTKVNDLTSGAALRQWGFDINEDGVALIVEYGSPSGAASIWKATSGNYASAWTKVKSFSNTDHIHCIAWHAALKRWVVSVGEGGADTGLWVCDNSEPANDGSDWTQKCGYNDGHDGLDILIQPTGLLDYDHASRLILASDKHQWISWIDVSDTDFGDTGRLVECWRPHASTSAGTNFCFDIAKINGIYYAGVKDNKAAGSRYATVDASEDLVHWTTVHRFSNNEMGIYEWMGLSGGKIHAVVTTSSATTYKHFQMDPVSLSGPRAIVLIPAATMETNSAANDDYSSFEDGEDWSASGGSGTLSRETDGTHSLHGDAYMKYVCAADDTRDYIYSCKYDITCNKTYVLHGWAKGTGGVLAIRARALEGATPDTTEAGHYIPLNPDYWTPIHIEAYTPEPDHDEYQWFIREEDKDGKACTVYFDCMHCEEAPLTSWHLEDGTSTADTLSWEYAAPAAWSNLFRIWPLCSSDELAADTNYFIKSWYYDADNYFEIYYDTTDNKFEVKRTDGGVGQAVKTIDCSWFRRQMPFIIGIRSDSNNLKLSVGGVSDHNTAGMAHVSDTAQAEFYSNTLTCKYGDNAGANLLPMAIADDRIYKIALTDAQMASYGSMAGAARRWTRRVGG